MNKILRVKVVSSSMEPVLRTGDSCWVRRDLKPRPGDIAAIENDSGLLIHRLVARISVGARTWYIHRGDASPAWGTAAASEIAGVVPGAWRRPEPPRTLLFLRLAALLRYLGLPGFWFKASTSLFSSSRNPVFFTS